MIKDVREVNDMPNTQFEGIFSQVDKDGNVVEMFPHVKTDDTFTIKGKPADAKAVGDKCTEFTNICDELRNSITEAINIAKGMNQAVVYDNYSSMVSALSGMGNTSLKRGYNIYIATASVPDLWVYSVEESYQNYTYTSDDALAEGIKNNVFVQIGYYKVAQLETQKVDLTPVNEKIAALEATHKSDIAALEARVKTMTTYQWDASSSTLNIITS